MDNQLLPLVSIITPSFNQGQFIERTIQSVLNQDYSNIEYIVMDGGSTDNTLDILKRYTGKLKWISEKDQGQAHAINKGLKESHGEIVAYLNSDDVYFPGAVFQAVQFLLEQHEYGMVYSNGYYIDAQDKTLKLYPTEKFDMNRLAENCFICQPAVFIRKSILTEVGYFDEKLMCSMDYDMWIRIAKKFSIGYVSAFWAGSRWHQDIKTIKLRKSAILESMKISKKYFGYIGREWWLTLYQYYIDEVFNKSTFWQKQMRKWTKTLFEYHQNCRAKYPTYHHNPDGLLRYWVRKQKKRFFET